MRYFASRKHDGFYLPHQKSQRAMRFNASRKQLRLLPFGIVSYL